MDTTMDFFIAELPPCFSKGQEMSKEKWEKYIALLAFRISEKIPPFVQQYMFDHKAKGLPVYITVTRISNSEVSDVRTYVLAWEVVLNAFLALGYINESQKIAGRFSGSVENRRGLRVRVECLQQEKDSTRKARALPSKGGDSVAGSSVGYS